jgi:hypothetical protein
MEVHATAMSVHDAILVLRRYTVPMFQAAIASGRWDAVAEAKAVADDLQRAQRAAKRLAAIADAIPCPDGLWAPSHGRAA